MTGYLAMDLPRFLALVRARRWLIAGIAVAAAVLALAASLAQPSQYRASADLLFGRTSNAADVVAGGAVDTGQTPERTAATNLALASLDTVAARVKRRLSRPETVEELKNSVSIAAQGQSDVVTVTATRSTPTQAAQVANAFGREIVALRRQAAQADIQRALDAFNAMLARPAGAAGGTGGANLDVQAIRDRISQLEALKALQTGDVRVVEAATPPHHRSSPKPVRNAVIAGVVALILALFLVVLLSRFDERIRDEDELVALMGAPVLARIPEVARSKRAENGWPHEDRSFVEAIEFLRLNLQLIAPQDERLVLAVTSPAAGDGKTTIVARLAQSLALSGADVVAVDFDLRNPMLHAHFDIPRGSDGGVVDVLLEAQSDGDPTQRTSFPRLRVLAGGDHPPLAPGLIAHERLRHLFARLRDDADYVLVDTSPVSSVADASAVAAAANGVILVVDVKRIRRKELLAARKQLANARTTILGIVLNRGKTEVSVYGVRDRERVTGDGAGSPTPVP
jgi:polysaccharide biosynthesis transport protein